MTDPVSRNDDDERERVAYTHISLLQKLKVRQANLERTEERKRGRRADKVSSQNLPLCRTRTPV